MDINKRLKWLKDRGCFPSIYRRGNLWRFHINRAGNFWADDKTPHMAMEAAVKLWNKKGCPMDGEAAITIASSRQAAQA